MVGCAECGRLTTRGGSSPLITQTTRPRPYCCAHSGKWTGGSRGNEANRWRPCPTTARASPAPELLDYVESRRSGHWHDPANEDARHLRSWFRQQCDASAQRANHRCGLSACVMWDVRLPQTGPRGMRHSMCCRDLDWQVEPERVHPSMQPPWLAVELLTGAALAMAWVRRAGGVLGLRHGEPGRRRSPKSLRAAPGWSCRVAGWWSGDSIACFSCGRVLPVVAEVVLASETTGRAQLGKLATRMAPGIGASGPEARTA